ncbi:large conductance mechanosensitive channel protein MscL [Leucobacter sp. GX24907]
MLKGFKEFLMRGNVIDLAVAVVIGAAFNAVVERVVASLFNPIIGMVFQADSLDTALMFDLPGGGKLAIGAVIGALINFVIVAAVVYFVFVLPMNKLRERGADDGYTEETTPSEQELLVEIRDLLRAQNASGIGASDAEEHAAQAADAADNDSARHGAHGQ